jgi:hypothetical protein
VCAETYEPTAHYWAANIYAVGEWAVAEIKRLGTDGEGTPLASEELCDVADWCWTWVENDPGDNGGDRTVRRGMRRHWPEIYRSYLRLRDSAR